MPPIHSITKERLTRALGQAVIRIWSNLPQDVQDHLFREAVASQGESIRSQLAVFLHDKHSRRRTHWATLAKRRSRIASGAEDIGKSGRGAARE
jgi:hypothetical protein